MSTRYRDAERKRKCGDFNHRCSNHYANFEGYAAALALKEQKPKGELK